MSNKEELHFISSDRCGSLYYYNVYSYYDEPIIFTAKNEFGQLFFCYRLGCENNFDNWIIAPTSQDRVNKLEQKEISILSMMKYSSSAKVILLKINLANYSIVEKLVPFKRLKYQMPSEDIFIRENINYDGTRKHSHKIRIARSSSSSKDILSETLNEASAIFGEFCRGFLKKHDISVAFYPQDALNGSFVYRVKTVTKQEVFYTEGYDLLSKLTLENSFESSIDNKEIDLRVLRKLFDVIVKNNLEIQLIDENSTNIILNLTDDYVEKVLPVVDDRLGTYLDSTMVPQADNLERIKSYLEIVNNQKIVTPDLLDVQERQVSYYRDACKLLSLIHDYASLTPLGVRVAQSSDYQDWGRILKRQFEESDCGNIWMQVCNVKTVADLDEESATDFLIEYCNGLSRNTSERRAQTLKAWVRKFKELS